MPNIKKQSKKSGRKLLPPERVRSRMIPVYVTPDLAAELAARRAETGQTESQQFVSAYLAWREHARSEDEK